MILCLLYYYPMYIAIKYKICTQLGLPKLSNCDIRFSNLLIIWGLYDFLSAASDYSVNFVKTKTTPKDKFHGGQCEEKYIIQRTSKSKSVSQISGI